MGTGKVTFRTLTAYGFAYLMISIVALAVVFLLSRTGRLHLS
jgi:hypothetical protein